MSPLVSEIVGLMLVSFSTVNFSLFSSWLSKSGVSREDFDEAERFTAKSEQNEESIRQQGIGGTEISELVPT